MGTKTLERFQILGAPTCRIVYPEGLFTKRLPKDTEGEPKYNAIIAIPKSDTAKITQLREKYEEAFSELKKLGFEGKSSKNIMANNNCLLDGNDYADAKSGREQFRDFMILKVASKKFRPTVIDKSKRVILNGVPIVGLDVEQMSDEELKDGDYIFANVSFWCYCNSVAKGIGCNVHAVLRMAEGEPLGASGMADIDSMFDTEGYV